MRIKKDDTVIVLAGKDKGKTGHRGDRVREGKESRGKRKHPRYPGGPTWCCVCKARLKYL